MMLGYTHCPRCNGLGCSHCDWLGVVVAEWMIWFITVTAVSALGIPLGILVGWLLGATW